MRLWKKLISKNYWLSTLLIAISIMLFNGIVAGLLSKWIGLKVGLLLDFLALMAILLLSRLITEEILEV